MHVSAVLFFTEYAIRLRDSKTCTEEKACWFIPGYSQLQYKQIKDIGISVPKNMKMIQNDMDNGED